jgi:hypothetical protein
MMCAPWLLLWQSEASALPGPLLIVGAGTTSIRLQRALLDGQVCADPIWGIQKEDFS